MSEPRRKYISYLLRLWQVDGEERPAWRASLENTRTGERHGFDSLDALMDFLSRQVELLSQLSGDTIDFTS